MKFFRKHKKKNPFLYHLITGTAIITFWRGLWGLLDIYIFPENLVLSYGISTIIGLAILFINDYSIEEIGN